MTAIVTSILKDLKTRKGFDALWSSLDDDVREEIESAWRSFEARVMDLDTRACLRIAERAYREGFAKGQFYSASGDVERVEEFWWESVEFNRVADLMLENQGGDASLRQIELMKHALGATERGASKDYKRNYFCASPGTDDDLDLSLLVKLKYVLLAQLPNSTLPYNIYVVTDEGNEFLER